MQELVSVLSNSPGKRINFVFRKLILKAFMMRFGEDVFDTSSSLSILEMSFILDIWKLNKPCCSSIPAWVRVSSVLQSFGVSFLLLDPSETFFTHLHIWLYSIININVSSHHISPRWSIIKQVILDNYQYIPSPTTDMYFFEDIDLLYLHIRAVKILKANLSEDCWYLSDYHIPTRDSSKCSSVHHILIYRALIVSDDQANDNYCAYSRVWGPVSNITYTRMIG